MKLPLHVSWQGTGSEQERTGSTWRNGNLISSFLPLFPCSNHGTNQCFMGFDEHLDWIIFPSNWEWLSGISQVKIAIGKGNVSEESRY